jgi:hypothetical protein
MNNHLAASSFVNNNCRFVLNDSLESVMREYETFKKHIVSVLQLEPKNLAPCLVLANCRVLDV